MATMKSIFSFIIIFSNVNSIAHAQVNALRSDPETEFLREISNESSGGVVSSKGFFEKISDGLSTKTLSPVCDPRRFEDEVVGKNLTTAQYQKIAKKYFDQCGEELTSQSSTGPMSLWHFSTYQYSFFSNPQIKSIEIKLPEGVTVPGILALKKDPRPRPLVIMKCGVFCSAGESPSTRVYLMHLFDQSPFNVLLLSNQTGLDHISLNKKFSLGGWTEGYEVIQIGKWMKEQWEYKDRISSIHLMGMSLGGNAAMMGSSYNDRFRLANGQKVYNSVTAVCPVVSLKPTLDYLYGTQFVGRVFANMTKNQFNEAQPYLEDVADLVVEEKMPSNRNEFPNYLSLLASTSLQRRKMPVDKNEFFKNNNFWNLKDRVQTPLLVWASHDDMVVNNKLNAKVVEFDDYYEKSENVRVLNLPYGNHCAFLASYGSFAAAAVLRTFVLSQSPEFSPIYSEKQTLPWKFGFKKMGYRDEHVGQSWLFEPKSDHALVTFQIFNWMANPECAMKGPWGNAHGCTKSVELNVPIESIKDIGGRVPQTYAEAEALTREFNTKVEFRTNGGPLNGTRNNDFHLSVRKFFE